MPCIINGVSEERLSPVVAERGGPFPLHNSWSGAVKWDRGKLAGHLQMSVIFEFAILWRCIRAARMLLLESPHSKMSHFDHRSSVQIKSDFFFFLSPPPPTSCTEFKSLRLDWPDFAHETNLFYNLQDKSIEPLSFVTVLRYCGVRQRRWDLRRRVNWGRKLGSVHYQERSRSDHVCSVAWPIL